MHEKNNFFTIMHEKIRFEKKNFCFYLCVLQWTIMCCLRFSNNKFCRLSVRIFPYRENVHSASEEITGQNLNSAISFGVKFLIYLLVGWPRSRTSEISTIVLNPGLRTRTSFILLWNSFRLTFARELFTATIICKLSAKRSPCCWSEIGLQIRQVGHNFCVSKWVLGSTNWVSFFAIERINYWYDFSKMVTVINSCLQPGSPTCCHWC